MIILVKVNQLYRQGSDPKVAAYRSWILGSLLDDSNLRNRFKYLVAYSGGKVVGTFCIHGAALDPPFKGNKRQVKFLLKETPKECDDTLKRIIYDLIASDSNKIQMTRSACRIDTNHLRKFSVTHLNLNCKCALDMIPVLESNDILE